MAQNYKLTLEYNGTDFHGSQAQNGAGEEEDFRTVEAELRKALGVFLKEGTKCVFSSRTDAGVHAIGQVVNFKTKKEIDLSIPSENGKTVNNGNCPQTLIALNGILPEDMAITKIELMGENFNSRFDAKSRAYLYKIFNRRSKPVLRLDSLHWEKEPLDFNAMAEHAKKFLGTQDFADYEASASQKEREAGEKPGDTICTVTRSELIKESDICFKYHIEANRFLRHMVRYIVNELIMVGKGQKPQKKAAPASGLCLIKVKY